MKWGIIGGSGFEKFDEMIVLEQIKMATPFGEPSSGLKRVKVGGAEAYFIPRHGSHHEKLPSEVNYRANIFALKKLGVTDILSISAIGSLKKELKPGDLVVPSQYIDRTKSIRAHTFLGDGVVGHVSLAKPICPRNIKSLELFSKSLGYDSHFGKTYVCVEGPYFSTQAESNSFRAMGADIIGMTNFPEYALAREAGIGYLPACFVTDYDCWDDAIPHVTLQEVIDQMRKNNEKAFRLAMRLLNDPPKHDVKCSCASDGLRAGLMTPKEAIPPSKVEWLQVLLG